VAGFFISPHSVDDAVGEVAFVGASGISAGHAFGPFRVRYCWAGLWLRCWVTEAM